LNYFEMESNKWGVNSFFLFHRTQEKLSQIKSVVVDVANSQPVQQTRRKTADFTSSAWHNLSKGISTLASSETIQNAKKKTLKTVYTINEALTSPPAKATNNTTENSSSVIFDDDKRTEIKTTTTVTTSTTTITPQSPTIFQSPSEEIEDPILHVIGDDFNDFL